MTTHTLYAFDIAVLTAIYILKIFPDAKKNGNRALIERTLFYLYLCTVIVLTLLPIIPTFDKPDINLIPFVDIINRYGNYILEVVENILLFVPMGFFLPYFYRTDLKKTILYCSLLSLFIELSQPWITLGRVCDITDFITNTLGGFLGYLVFLLIHTHIEKMWDSLQK